MSFYTEMNDEELVALAGAGDNEAFEEISERYKEAVKIRAASYFLDGGDRDDILQEGMIGLFKAVMSYKPERQVKFTTFAGVCIDRQLVSAVRKASSLKNDPLNRSVPIPEGEIPERGHAKSAEEIFFARLEAADGMEKLQGTLSELEKGILSKLTEGKTYREIAELEGISLKSADNAIQRIKKKALKALK